MSLEKCLRERKSLSTSVQVECIVLMTRIDHQSLSHDDYIGQRALEAAGSSECTCCYVEHNCAKERSRRR